MIHVGCIGYGYWGPNLVRNFWEADGSKVVAVSDLDEKRLLAAKSRYPMLHTTTDHRELFADPGIDAIAIATPVATHFDLALQALQAGKHVFVEKPLTDDSERAQQLLDEAQRRNLILHVDHTFVYCGAVRKIKELIASGEVGDLYYYDSVRVNLGLIQPDVSVIWDLAVHDLAILAYLLPTQPEAVSATGMAHVVGKPPTIAFLSLFYDHGMIAHVHVNWLAPVKVRRVLLGGSRRMIVYDDIEPSEKVKVYDKGVAVDDKESVYKTLISYRTGDMRAPKLDATEALAVETSHFIECVERGEQSDTGGHAGMMVVRILEAADRSMRERGRPVSLRR